LQTDADGLHHTGLVFAGMSLHHFQHSSSSHPHWRGTAGIQPIQPVKTKFSTASARRFFRTGVTSVSNAAVFASLLTIFAVPDAKAEVLDPSDGAQSDNFGQSADLNGTSAAIGSCKATGNGLADRGSAYYFRDIGFSAGEMN
jgi:hypothetical protein